MGQLALCATTEYRPRSPEQTVLYKTVASHINTFFAMAEGEGKHLPKYVHDEFEAYLRCGIHAYGFLRLKCDGCRSERLPFPARREDFARAVVDGA